MRIIFCAILYIMIFVPLFGQADSIVLNRIKSISPKDTTSFQDLEFFKTTLKNKKIVFLGEGTHDDGLTLEAKTRLIQYLHKELDYNVLLLEYGFTEMDRMWRDIKEKKDSVTGAFCWFAPNGLVTDITEPYQNLAYYIQSHLNTDNELFLGGIDVIESTAYANAFESELESLLAKHCKGFFTNPIYEYFKKFTRKGEMELVYFDSKGMKKRFKGLDFENFKIWATKLNVFIDSLLKKNELTKNERNNLETFQQGIISRLGFLEWNLTHKIKKNRKEISYEAYTKIRDKYMAKNLLWYIEKKFPNKKIIVSASSLHTSKYLNKIKEAKSQMGDLVTAGEITYEKYKDDIYSIAFINYNGSGGFFEGDTMTLRYSEKVPNSLEYYLHHNGEKYSFLDLHNAKKNIPLCREEYFMHATLAKPYKANWEKVYDGVFYIDKMKPMKTFSYTNRLGKRQPYYPHPDWYKGAEIFYNIEP